MAPPIVACLKVGTMYGPEYVNRLAAMVRRHATVPHEFVCLTDNATGIDCESCPVGCGLPGWWAKLVLFQPHPRLAGARVVFLDLDTVIVGNLDWLLQYNGPFAILRDFYRPTGYGSAVMSIAPGFGGHVWQRFTPDVMRLMHGDQNWLERQVPHADRWQDIAPGKIGSYKADGLQDGPKGFAVCAFHGRPKPHEVNGWICDAWR